MNKGSIWSSIEHVAMNIDDARLKKECKKTIENVFESLPHYVIEAIIRWIILSERLQDLYWRKEAMEDLSITYQSLPIYEEPEDLPF